MNNISAIELGSEKIACTIASVEDTPEKKVRILGFASIPSRGIKRAQIVDIQVVTKNLEECLTQAERMAGTRINNAVLVTSGPSIASQTSHGIVAVTYQNQDISEEDVGRAIESAKAISLASTREIIHVIPQQFIVDGQAGIKNPIGMTGVRLEVDTHIISASAINLNNIRKACSILGVNVDGIIFAGLASAQAVVTDTEKELGCVLVDIGAGTSDISVYVDGSLVHTSVIPLGSKNVTSDIAAGLRVSLPSAEKIKLSLSTADRKATRNSGKKTEDALGDELSLNSLHLPERMSSVSRQVLVNGILKPRLEEIAEFINNELTNNQLKDLIPAGVIITGGGALTPYMDEVLGKVLGLPVRIGYPPELDGIADELKEPSYSSLVGALLYSSTQEETPRSMAIPNIANVFKNIKIKDSFQKMVDFFKSFIPGAK